ncbi:restriction endonuclease subunit S [Tolypothrix sp. VBCCA 56010]|uniref:restriction endonuclease subunit S n=1 Tax=Tolypothrix sp. VBCCA 56010 TaxID=3137731 RepID=UPI003D7CEC28
MSDKTHQKYPVSVQHGKPRLAPLKEGWNRLSISDLVEEVIRPVVMEDDELYTLVTAKRSRGGIVEREKLKGRDIAVKSQFYIREDDFLISKRQIVHGACGFVPKQLDGAIVSNEYLVLNFTDKIIPEFWNFLSHTVYFQQICFHSSIGVHIEKMLFKVEQWYRWKINIPSLEEQEKIASFLGSVDRRLTQLRRKQELLQTYKRGVIQKLFSQQIRFTQPDGSPFSTWQEKRLGQLATRQTKKNDDQSISRVLTNSAIQGVIDQQDYFDKDIANSENLANYYVIEKGDYVYNPRISMNAPVGPINKNKIGLGVMSPLYTVFRFKSQENTFYEQYFKTSMWHKYMCSVANYGARHDRMNITTSDFMNLPLPYPHPEEQQKISNFITVIDQKIEAISRQIYHTEKLKKGLLQKMFV